MREIDAGSRTDGAADELKELLDRRERIEDWLSRLNSESGASERVVARVRNDYLRQLREVLDSMASHRDALRARAKAIRENIDRSSEAADQAEETLEEIELRHRIGEVSEDEWQARRPDLDRAARTARDRLEKLRAELGELDGIVQAIDSANDGDTDVIDEETVEAPAVVEETVEEGRDEAVPSDPAPDGDDRDPEDDDFVATRPGPGVKCPRCGYKNDVGAIYCGVCGIELP